LDRRSYLFSEPSLLERLEVPIQRSLGFPDPSLYGAERAAQATACSSSWPCSSCLHLLGGAAFAVSVGVAWLDQSFEQYVWFSFVGAVAATVRCPPGLKP